MNSTKRYGCKLCRKEVVPKNGRLICCGHNEPVPAPRKPRSEYSNAAREFLGLSLEDYLDESIGMSNGCDVDDDWDDNDDWY